MAAPHRRISDSVIPSGIAYPGKSSNRWPHVRTTRTSETLTATWTTCCLLVGAIRRNRIRAFVWICAEPRADCRWHRSTGIGKSAPEQVQPRQSSRIQRWLSHTPTRQTARPTKCCAFVWRSDCSAGPCCAASRDALRSLVWTNPAFLLTLQPSKVVGCRRKGIIEQKVAKIAKKEK